MSDMTIDRAQVHIDVAAAERERSIDNQKFGMWLYLASEVVIFSILIGAYVLFRVNEPDKVANVQKHANLLLVSLNTFLLLMSSWAMVMGLLAIQRGNRQGLMRWIGLTALLGTIFVVGQFVEYTELGRAGVALNYPDVPAEISSLEGVETGDAQAEFGGFGMRFFAPTGFHGAHVIVGVLWALLVLYRAAKGRYDENPVGVEIFGLYWHFVDVVWILLFTLIYLI